MSFFEYLTNKALKDNYLNFLVHKTESIYGQSLFNANQNNLLTEKEYYDLLRFSDILSRSEKPKARNIALKIISLLYEFSEYNKHTSFKRFSTSVLTKLGNFPSLNIGVCQYSCRIF